MGKTSYNRIGLAIAAGSSGTFFGRGALLRRIAGQKIGQLEQRLDLRIAYDELRFASFSDVELKGLSVVPPQRDTLLRLEYLRLRLDVLPLLQRKLSVRSIDADGLSLSFVKKHGVSNYDCLFRSPKKTVEDEARKQVQADYATRVKRLADVVFRILPENGGFNRVRIIGQRDSLVTSLTYLR